MEGYFIHYLTGTMHDFGWDREPPWAVVEQPDAS